MRQVINIQTGAVTWEDDAPPSPIEPATAEQNKQTAMSLLQSTDWVNQPDVRNTTLTPHLINASDFDAYRLELRQIAVYPTDGDLTWPVAPTEQWSN